MATTERRAKRTKAKGKGKNKGHGRNGAKDYPGAEHVAVSHPELKASGPCPEPLCRGKLYDTHAANKDVELKAQPPIQATVYERQMLRCASCQKTFTAPLSSQAWASKYHPSVDAVVSVLRYAMGRLLGLAAVSELAIGIATPRPHGAVFSYCETMVHARRDGLDGRQARNGKGNETLVARQRAHTELVGGIRAPGPHGAILVEGEVVVLARGNCDDVRQVCHLNGNRAVGLSTSNSELSEVVPSPRPDISIRAQCECVVTARGDGFNRTRL